MFPSFLLSHTLCRGCLGPIDRHAEAGLCGLCWKGLSKLPGDRCPKCALTHDPETPCRETPWIKGDALWDYHGGHPPLGSLLIPAIKSGESGWKSALLGRLKPSDLPEWCASCDLVTSAPSAFHRRLLRGFDLAEEAACIIAGRLHRPYASILWKSQFTGRQANKNRTERQRLAKSAIKLKKSASIQNMSILLVDDVWTTGSTLLRCSQALLEGGAKEISVLALFRAVI